MRKATLGIIRYITRDLRKIMIKGLDERYEQKLYSSECISEGCIQYYKAVLMEGVLHSWTESRWKVWAEKITDHRTLAILVSDIRFVWIVEI